tara:strand:+ start:901 stop:1533 length:633 start_codon:yes stop_codon:yes gene_type:complete
MKTNQEKTFNPLSKFPIILLSILLGLLLCYIFIIKTFPHLDILKEVYGPFYWRRLLWIIPHTSIGILALIIGPFLFFPYIERNYESTYQKLNRVYLLTTVIGGISGMLLATISDFELPYVYSIGLFLLCLTWAGSSIKAYFASKNEDEELYKEWLIRSYVITLAFVLFRFILDILLKFEIGGNGDTYALMSWVVPLLLAEIIIQWNKKLP